MIIHACAANADTIFQSYIYYYTLCSETFYWEPEKANLMNIGTDFFNEIKYQYITTVWKVFRHFEKNISKILEIERTL
jgi:hypothetical protein